MLKLGRSIRMMKANKFIPGIIFAFILIVFAIVNENKRSKEVKEVLSNFSSIQITENISSRVKKIYYFNNIRNSETTVLFTLENGKKYRLSTRWNDKYTNREGGIANIINKGDLILKSTGSDTIFVKKDKERVFFYLLERDDH